MRFLLLCEGNPETHDSWSGVSRSLLLELRRAGHTVIPGDAELYGWDRVAAALNTFSPRRRRWWVRYHLEGAPFARRSARAAHWVAQKAQEVDFILQIGATFQVTPPPGVPLILYCDSNIDLSMKGAATGYSEAIQLTAGELAGLRLREEEVYRSATLIFTMSHRLRHSFQMDFGIPEERLVTIHCAPNVEIGPDPGEERGSEAPVVLFVGRDMGRKGGDLLLKVFPRVLERVPEARLRIVGSRPRGTWPDWVEFTGYLNRDDPAQARALDRAYRSSRVFCLPTRFEPFGTSFVEAMAYGLPCIGPDHWAVPEIILHEETGLLVPPEDLEALADALVRLLTDPGRARAMGMAGAERVRKHFTWPRIVRQMEEALAGVRDEGLQVRAR